MNRKTQLRAARRAAARHIGGAIWSYRLHTPTGSATGTVGAPTMLDALEEIQRFSGMRVEKMVQLEIQRYDWVE